MDPLVALRTWRHAVREGLEEEAYAAADALVSWMNRGGFKPRGLKGDELRALRADARAYRAGRACGCKRGAGKACGCKPRPARGKASGRTDRSATEIVSLRCSDCSARSPQFEVPFGARWDRNVPPTVIGWMNKHGAMHGRAQTARPAGHAVGFEYDPSFADQDWVKAAVRRAKTKTARLRLMREAARQLREKERLCEISARPMRRPASGYAKAR